MIEYFLVNKERRQQGRFAGFSIYVSSNGARDNSSLCYKDGPKLPALNFTTSCITSGRYVTFYNERLHAVTYPDGYVVDSVFTELCEVTVHGENIYKYVIVRSCLSTLALILSLLCQIQVNKYIINEIYEMNLPHFVCRYLFIQNI